MKALLLDWPTTGTLWQLTLDFLPPALKLSTLFDYGILQARYTCCYNSLLCSQNGVDEKHIHSLM